MFHTPVLIIVFNRPSATNEIVDVLRKVKPYNLYVAADGPRQTSSQDVELCQSVREIISKIDWVCNLKTLFRSENLGCGKGPANAITWFFNYVEEGIILEDDSIPHVDFFKYCEELLATYRYNNKIKIIGSANFQEGNIYNDGSYYFSMQNGCFCSWATWRRTWMEYDYALDKYDINFFKRSLKAYNVSLKEYVYWIDVFNAVKSNRYNESCWDYQLMFAIWKNKGLGIVPNVNLSTNIGFNSDATHTFDISHIGANKISEAILPIRHSTKIMVERNADLFYHNLYYQPPVSGRNLLVFNFVLINKFIKSLFNIKQSWKNQLVYLLHKVYMSLATVKTEFKNWLFWSNQGRWVRRSILNHYDTLSSSEISPEELEVVNHLKKNKITMLPYSFMEKYPADQVEVLYDSDCDLHYVLFDDKKLYYKRGWSKKKIKSYHAYLLAEQDKDSPHRYLSDIFGMSPGSNLIDAGAAEGIFTLMNIRNIERAHLFEPDSLWVEALQATFAPWSEKITIIDKFIGSTSTENMVSIDQLFEDKQVDFIKVDVEGCERDLLEGAIQTLISNQALKISIATYHKQNDELDLKERLTTLGFKTNYSRGFVAYHYDTEIQFPFLRKCLIRAEK